MTALPFIRGRELSQNLELKKLDNGLRNLFIAGVGEFYYKKEDIEVVARRLERAAALVRDRN